MTDKDIVDRAAKLMQCTIQGPYQRHGTTYKPVYRLAVYGRYAISWMMTLYSLMGYRRQEKIMEILTHYKTTPGLTMKCRKPYWERHKEK